ncbi:hypothetical protein [Oceanobacter kriegii]|uniref:hypothetical protein n=1 Tax=Oceanobacter kriegii TaxID=64972 RepID=UPI0012EB16A1|nr:hypothetical protein [Oceanobacter kriegii]
MAPSIQQKTRHLAIRALSALVSIIAGMLGATSEILADTAHLADFPHAENNEFLIGLSITAMCILLVGFVLWYCFIYLKAQAKAVGRKRRFYRAPAIANDVFLASLWSRGPPPVSV